MPFDALLAPADQRALTAVLESCGVARLSQVTLADHKQKQLEKFRPSFWYQHQTWLLFALLGSVGCMAISGGLSNGVLLVASPLTNWLTFVWMGVIGLLVIFGVFQVHAGSRWEERWVPVDALDGLGVPEPIARLARQLYWRAPGSTLILGELIQEEVVLDPYLLLELGSERMCLGIWDGERIIACADYCSGATIVNGVV